jgi:hypothetical protein
MRARWKLWDNTALYTEFHLVTASSSILFGQDWLSTGIQSEEMLRDTRASLLAQI